ncbi:MAG: RNA-directed DNA polymerase, partial [Oscillospiraceae bacterium]
MPYKLLCEVMALTSEERQDGRFHRDRAARKARAALRNKPIEDVFTLRQTYRGYCASTKGVRWKPSTQTYRANGARNVRKTQKEVLDGSWKSKGFIERDISDRGKSRHIKSVHISERVVQHTLCDNLLTPVLTPTLIYDNCGSLKNKGMDFALRRLSMLTREQLRRHGKDLYVLTYDFSGYFGNIDHDCAMQLIERYIADPRNVRLVRQLVDDFGEVGLGLGSQVSQNIATSLPNRIDHAFKEELGIRCYVRYMDDGIAIHHSRAHLEHCLERLRELCAELGITVNEKKTGIKPISKGFVFLKMRFNV